MLASFQNMFKPGGVFSPQMMDAFTPLPPMQGPQQQTGMSFEDSQRGTFYASQRARANLRASASRLTTGMGALNRRGAAESLDNRLAVAMKSATLFGEELIKAKGKLEEDRILKERDLALDKARLAQKEEIAKLTGEAEKTFLDNLLKSDDIGTPEKEAAKKFLKQLQDDPLLARFTRTRLETQQNLSPQDKLLLDYLRAQIDGEANSRAKGKTSIDEVNKSYDANKKAVDKNTKSQTDLFNESKKFQYSQRIGKLRFDADLASATPEGLRRMQQGTAPGYEGQRFGITNREIADAARDARMKNFRAGKGSLNFGKTFRETFSYGDNDALLEFDNGVRDVAENMKSSFASAFQSISSGASDLRGAVAGMAQSILNSISQVSSQMFANMLFSRMFAGGPGGDPSRANGGYIPGYAGGGLVTGGSGYKDDVLTKMQGGEFVIKKSAVNKIGVGTLNAINGYANGGQTPPSMGAMGMLALGAGAASGIIGAAMAPKPDKPLPMQNYGQGRSELGYLGGADPDAGRVDSISGGGRSANVSLAKGFVYYRRDPETGRLISERARPTEGRFEVSDRLSLMGRLSEGDPQTARMFEKEQAIANYQNYVAQEKASRKAQIQAVKDQKKARTMGAFMNAAMLIGGAHFTEKSMAKRAHADATAGFDNSRDAYETMVGGKARPEFSHPSLFSKISGGFKGFGGLFGGGGNNANGGLAKVMGGEYVMSPQAVRTHGVGFMSELNRGNVPGYASGGLVGAGGGGGATVNNGGNMTNNVKINVNIDKSGQAKAETTAQGSSGSDSAREENEEAQNNSELGEVLQGVVIEEIIKQQRPGGLLHKDN